MSVASSESCSAERLIVFEKVALLVVDPSDFSREIGETDDGRQRAAEIVGEHRDQIALRLIEFQHGATAFVEFVIERHVAGRHGKIFGDQIEDEEIGISQRMASLGPEFEGIAVLAETAGKSHRPIAARIDRACLALHRVKGDFVLHARFAGRRSAQLLDVDGAAVVGNGEDTSFGAKELAQHVPHR